MTPNPDADIIDSVERYIVWPGQATAYTVGMKEILDLRAYARSELGGAFAISEFHAAVLSSGAVPLAILKQLVESWIAKKRHES